MAVLDVSEYHAQAVDQGGNKLPAGQEPSIADQQLAIGSEVKSAAFKGSFVRIHADAACRILFGANPTASSTSKRMAANTTEFFGVTPGHKVSCITSS